MTSTKKSKSKKVWIYWGIGLVILVLVVGGGIFLWKRSKSSNESESTEEPEDIDIKDIPQEIKEHRKKNWTEKESGYNNYQLPPFPANISPSRAKDEVLEAIYQWGGKQWDRKKIEKFFKKNAPQMSNFSIKVNPDEPLYNEKLLESLAEKFSSDIFFNPPNQTKFDNDIRETELSYFFLLHAYDLKYKSKSEIDWLASLRKLIERGRNKKTKTQSKEFIEKITVRLEREINPSIIAHAKKFPNLTNLAELNKWTNYLALKQETASILVCNRWYEAQSIGQKVPSPSLEKGGVLVARYPNSKNKKFDLEPVICIYEARDEK